MLELIHAVITSLLLSAAMGGSVDKSAEAGDEPANSETGVDIGKMPSHLIPSRGLPQVEQADDEDQPVAVLNHAAFCEPIIWGGRPLTSVDSLPLVACSLAAGRSP